MYVMINVLNLLCTLGGALRETVPPPHLKTVLGYPGSLGICQLQATRELYQLAFSPQCSLRSLCEVLLVLVPTLVYFLPHHSAVFP